MALRSLPPQRKKPGWATDAASVHLANYYVRSQKTMDISGNGRFDDDSEVIPFQLLLLQGKIVQRSAAFRDYGDGPAEGTVGRQRKRDRQCCNKEEKRNGDRG